MQFIPIKEGGLKLILPGETHTLGNVLNTKINEYEEVLFSGYNVPHPLDKTVSIEMLSEGKKEEDVLLLSLISLEKDLVSLRDSLYKICKK